VHTLLSVLKNFCHRNSQSLHGELPVSNEQVTNSQI